MAAMCNLSLLALASALLLTACDDGACVRNSECAAAQACHEGTCRTRCETHADCSSQEACDGAKALCLPGERPEDAGPDGDRAGGGPDGGVNAPAL